MAMDNDETTPAVPDSGPSRDAGVPGWLDTYSLAYAFGLVWLALELALMGLRPLFAFDIPYDFLLVFPPFMTALCVLLVDRYGSRRSLLWRVPLLATVAAIVSVLSTVVLTPFLALSFRQGVGRDARVTGIISAIALVAVGWPMIAGLVSNVRKRRWVHVASLVVGLAFGAVALLMALNPNGPLAASLRLDQAEIEMITASWWLPVFALAAAYARRIGLG